MIETEKILDTLKFNVEKGFLLPFMPSQDEISKKKLNDVPLSISEIKEEISKKSSCHSIVMKKYDLNNNEDQHYHHRPIEEAKKKTFRCATFQN